MIWQVAHPSVDSKTTESPEELTPAAYHPLLRASWAKLDPFLSVPEHLQDVSAFATLLAGSWPELARSSGERKALCALIGLHDLGKLGEDFQHRIDDPTRRAARAPEAQDVSRSQRQARDALAQLGARPALRDGQDHEARSAQLLFETLLGDERRRGRIAQDFPALLALSSHHGAPLGPQAQDPDLWSDAARVMTALHLNALKVSEHELRTLINGSAPDGSAPNESAPPGARWASTAGLCVLSDWLASGFPLTGALEAGPLDHALTQRWPLAVAHAQQTLTQIGWHASATLPEPTHPDRPLHAAVRELIGTLEEPEVPLIIIHAPTGEGKTGAAVLAARELQQKLSLRGLHVTLPNRAASAGTWKAISEMFGDDERLEPVLSQAGSGRGWFGSRGRSLLAPVGVGTIDQVLMGVLATEKWNQLRLLGISGKTLVLDEIHASDTHSMTLIKTLLPWARALGTPVILMSATLERSEEEALIQAWKAPVVPATGLGRTRRATVKTEPMQPGTAQPKGAPPVVELRLITSTRDERRAPPSVSPSRLVEMSHLSGEIERDALSLLAESQPGERAALICATVSRAQQAAEVLFDHIGVAQGRGSGAVLLHGRMTAQMRRVRAALLEQRCGPRGRGQEIVAVGTSVLGISLDLDFDLLASDPCPADELIQRLGRLWRHQRARVRDTAPLMICGARGGALLLGTTQEPEGWKQSSWLSGPLYLAQMEAATERFGHRLRLPDDARSFVEDAAAGRLREWPGALLRANERHDRDDQHVIAARSQALGSPAHLPGVRLKSRHGSEPGQTRAQTLPSAEILPLVRQQGKWHIYATGTGHTLPVSPNTAREQWIPVHSQRLIARTAALREQLIEDGDFAELLSRFPRLQPVEVEPQPSAPGDPLAQAPGLRFSGLLGLQEE